jgi:hypothetical protein
MKFSVRVVEGTSNYHAEIEASSAEAAIRQLNQGRGQSPAQFVFLGLSAALVTTEGSAPDRARRTALSA